MQFTVYFESPFWVGLLEEERDGVLYAARIVFGAEPTNQALFEFVLHHLNELRLHMAIGVKVESPSRQHKNPKRMQRDLRREMERVGRPSKAHEAIRQQIEQHKRAHSQQSKAEREEERERQRKIKTQKAKDRRRGRG